jgi:hypothetical protein
MTILLYGKPSFESHEKVIDFLKIHFALFPNFVGENTKAYIKKNQAD